MTTRLHTVLPLPDQALRFQYRQLVEEIDSAVARLVSSHFTGILQCGPGCSFCCTAFSIFPLEAALLSQIRKQNPATDGALGNRCQLLVDDSCSIYPQRPIICRTQGLPIAYVNDDAIEVSACPLNFTADYQFKHEELLFLDRFNRRLAELNLRYCRAAGINPELRIPVNIVASFFGSD